MLDRAGVMVLTLPLSWLLLERSGLGHFSGDGEHASMTLRAAMKSRAYWILAFASMSVSGSVSAISVHSMPMLTDRGWSVGAAGTIVGLLVLLTIPARLLTGIYSDRLAAHVLPRILGGTLLIESLTFLADSLFQTDASLLVLLVAKGIATGVPTVMIVVISVARFGKARLGTIQGSFMFLQVPGTMAGPVLAGWSYDSVGSYAPAVGGFGVMLLVSGIALQFADRRSR